MKKFVSTVFFGFFMIIMIGCGGGSDGTTSTQTLPIQKGYVWDSPISGLDYECGDIIGVTNEKGMFECRKFPVTFRIGNLTIGTVSKMPTDKKVYPQDIIGKKRTNFTDAKVVELTRFLQSLDDDGNIDKSIKITPTIKKNFKTRQRLSSISVARQKALVEGAGKTYVTKQDAMTHLKDNIQKLISIMITPTKRTIEVGKKATFKAEGTFSTGVKEDISSVVTWSSSKPSISTMATNIATAKSVGTTTIKATYKGKSKTTTLSVTAIPNKKPKALEQNLTINEDNNITISLTGSDEDSDNLTFKIVTPPVHGTVKDAIYTPTLNYNGKDSFTFVANDGKIDSELATINITVTSINDLPTINAGADQNRGFGANITLSSIASDIDGTLKNYIWKEGNKVLASSKSFSKSDFSIGTHVITVSVSDDLGAIATDNVTIKVACNGKALPKTGQLISYHNNDDGDLQKGTERSYTRDDALKIVTDNVTGLMWQDDVVISKPWIIQSNYDAEDYNNTSGDTATSYCSNLTLGGYNNWRLPSGKELFYLVDVDKKPTINSIFKSISASSNIYWSSDNIDLTYAKLAEVFDYNISHSHDFKKFQTFKVRCVRGKNKIINHFIRNSQNIVIDSKTCLMWQDDLESKEATKTWQDAIEYCEDLTLSGYNDWHLPNINESFSIRDKKTDKKIKKEFLNTNVGFYWSSTKHPYSKIDMHYGIEYWFGDVYSGNDLGTLNIRCVRDVKNTD